MNESDEPTPQYPWTRFVWWDDETHQRVSSFMPPPGFDFDAELADAECEDAAYERMSEYPYGSGGFIPVDEV